MEDSQDGSVYDPVADEVADEGDDDYDPLTKERDDDML